MGSGVVWFASVWVMRAYSRQRFRQALRRRGLTVDETDLLVERYHSHIGIRELIRLAGARRAPTRVKR
jgi:hypothetical protein